MTLRSTPSSRWASRPGQSRAGQGRTSTSSRRTTARSRWRGPSVSPIARGRPLCASSRREIIITLSIIVVYEGGIITSHHECYYGEYARLRPLGAPAARRVERRGGCAGSPGVRAGAGLGARAGRGSLVCRAVARLPLLVAVHAALLAVCVRVRRPAPIKDAATWRRAFSPSLARVLPHRRLAAPGGPLHARYPPLRTDLARRTREPDASRKQRLAVKRVSSRAVAV